MKKGFIVFLFSACFICSFGQIQNRLVFGNVEFGKSLDFPTAGNLNPGLSLQYGNHSFQVFCIIDEGLFKLWGGGGEYKYYLINSPRIRSFFHLTGSYFEESDIYYYGGLPVKAFLGVGKIGSGVEYRLFNKFWLTGQAGFFRIRIKIGPPISSPYENLYDGHYKIGLKYQIPLNAFSKDYCKGKMPEDSDRAWAKLNLNLRLGYPVAIFETPFPNLTPEIEIPISKKLHIAGGPQVSIPLKAWWGGVPYPDVHIGGFYAGVRLLPVHNKRLDYYFDLMPGILI